MAQENDLSIFSAPALEVVFHWWLESNRRWTERDDAKALIVPENHDDDGPDLAQSETTTSRP